jgi:hypothetical protein
MAEAEKGEPRIYSDEEATGHRYRNCREQSHKIRFWVHAIWYEAEQY